MRKSEEEARQACIDMIDALINCHKNETIEHIKEKEEAE